MKPAKMALTMRMLILIPELFGAGLGIGVFIDPFGYFRITDFITARTLMNLRAAVLGFTDVVVIFYCMDMCQAFKCSRTNSAFAPFLVRHTFGLPLILFIGITMVFGDLTVSWLSLRGMISGSSAALGALPSLVIYVTSSVILTNLSLTVSKQVASVE